MKKLLKILPLVLVALFATTLWSCSDEDDNKVVSNTELPATAKAFLDQYYPSIDYITVKEKSDYEVALKNGHSVEFNKDGEWKDVDAPKGQTIPSGFYPSAIDTYVAENEGGATINEISKKSYGFEVDLTNDKDLEFDKDGAFLRYSK